MVARVRRGDEGRRPETVSQRYAERSPTISTAYTLLVFAGTWALMQGITTIVRAAEIRALREKL